MADGVVEARDVALGGRLHHAALHHGEDEGRQRVRIDVRAQAGSRVADASRRESSPARRGWKPVYRAGLRCASAALDRAFPLAATNLEHVSTRPRFLHLSPLGTDV